MKKGINQWLFPDTMGIEACMALAKEAGFDGIELCLSEGAKPAGQSPSNLADEAGIGGYRSELALDTPEEDIRSMAAAAERIGIEVTSVCSALYFPYPLTSPDPEIRAKGIETARKAIQSASLLGAEIALVIPGIVTPEVSYSQALESSKAILDELVAAAGEAGVYLAIENVWNKFLLSPLEFRDYIDSFQSEHICALFDVANILAYGYPEEWIEVLGSRVKSVHVKDFKMSAGNIEGFVNVLQGDVNWPGVMESLRRIRYDGYLTVESIPAYKHCPDSQVYEASIALDRLINL